MQTRSATRSQTIMMTRCAGLLEDYPKSCRLVKVLEAMLNDHRYPKPFFPPAVLTPTTSAVDLQGGSRIAGQVSAFFSDCRTSKKKECAYRNESDQTMAASPFAG
jgi:hypothetical protein